MRQDRSGARRSSPADARPEAEETRRLLHLLEHRRIAWLLVPLTFCYLLVGFDQGLNVYDEGLLVYGAARLLNGELPYRDFWSCYPPAQFYTLAALFRVFGPSLLVERVLTALLMAALPITAYFAARMLVPRAVALSAWCLLMTWLGSFRIAGSPVPPALLLSLVSGMSLLGFFARERRAYLFLSGVLAGLAALYRHDIGLGMFLALALVATAYVFVNRTREEMRVSARLRSALRQSGALWLGMAVVSVPAAASLLLAVPFRDLFFNFYLFPARIYPEVRALPFPALLPDPGQFPPGAPPLATYWNQLLDRIPFYFPFLVHGSALLLVLSRLRAGGAVRDRERVWGMMLFLAMGAVFFHQVMVRPDPAHLLPLCVPTAVLFATLLAGVPRAVASRRLGQQLLAALTVAAVLVVWRPVSSRIQASPAPHFAVTLERARGLTWDDSVRYYEKLVRFIQDQVPAGERIFVGNTRHDQIFINDVMCYFLADRHSATKYHELHPGVATTRPVQRQIVAEIEQSRVHWIVLRHDHWQESEPNASFRSSGVSDLDDHIREHFAVRRAFGAYTVWQRKAVTTLASRIEERAAARAASAHAGAGPAAPAQGSDR